MQTPESPMSKTAAPPAILRALTAGLKALASLRLTVALFVLSLVLVFCGTLAQRDEAIFTVVNEYFRSVYVWIPLRNLVFVRVPGGFPYPGGLVIGGALLLNLLAAHLVRFRLSWKRAGILVLHAGVVLLLVGELVTRFFAAEGIMSIEQGATSNFLEDVEHTELAVIERSDPKTDDVTAVPDGLLRPGAVVRDDALPFDVEVVRYMRNSTIQDEVRPGDDNPATTGDGRHVLALARPPIGGANPNGLIDLASAYVTFRKKGGGEPLGTYLVSLWLSFIGERPNQVVEVDGKAYEVTLRFKRTYKPYAIHLVEFKHDVYPGTEIAKNYSSLVRLNDPSRGEGREQLIYMNHPMRYHGETLYQSGVLPGDAGTKLQVVRNPGWLLPYFACALVSLGMLFHFGVTLVGFIHKRMAQLAAAGAGASPAGWSPPEDEEPAAALPAPAAPRAAGQITTQRRGAGTEPARNAITLPRKSARAPQARPRPAPVPAAAGFARAVPWVVAGIGALYVLWAMVPPGDPPGAFQLQSFATLPAVGGGRVKPLDTVARTSLVVISGQQDFKDKKGVTQPAIKWLLDVMTSRRPFDNPAALEHKVFRIDNDQVLGLLKLQPREGYRYSVDEIADHVPELAREADRARKVEAAQRDLFDNKVLELEHKLGVYMGLAQLNEPLLIPPQPGASSDRWLSLRDAVVEEQETKQPNPDANAFLAMLASYSHNDTQGFNKALAAYNHDVEGQAAAEGHKTGFEVFFNSFAPFLQCSVLYVLVLILAALSWLGWTRPLSRAAFGLALVTLAVHTFALVARMIISGRPPVTNLYSSAVFIGWVGVGLCLVFEYLYRNGISVFIAGLGGFVTMLIAHLLVSGDTMEVLVAVLDTNFWLATHVVCVTIGYATTYVAGLFGMAYIASRGLGLLVPSLDKGLFKVLSTIVYGTVCFAMLFSFTGTVLGGIWADQSWGRFWGWDPKENGAVLIVIWNALILHARWGGLVKERGIAVLAVVGNVITSWSWFGTNLLGIGLHNYGFMNGAFWGLLVAVTVFLVWAGFGLFLPTGARRPPIAEQPLRP
jgi:ABC-type transport system involved in cytochrome c biogenesis permease subunit